MNRRLWLLALTVLLLAGCNLAGDVTPPPALATSQASPHQESLPTATPVDLSPPDNAPDPQAGAAIYTEQCAVCHGPTGLGDGPQAASLPLVPAALGASETARAASPAEWYAVVTEGRTDHMMPGFASLSAQERWDVVAYALSLSSAPQTLEQGKALFKESCAECHGPDGKGKGEAPDLTSPVLLAEDTGADLFTTISSGRGDAMPAFADQLSEGQRWSLVSYVRSLPFAEPAPEPEATAVPEATATPGGEEAFEGTVVGRVINGSEGGEIPEGLEITLHGFDGQQQVLQESTTIEKDGTFRFEGLEPVPGRLFVVSAEYGGVLYGSEVGHLMQGEPVELPLTIYESTTDASELRVERLHLLFDFPAEGVMQVIELWLLSNTGDRTITPAEGETTYEVILPEGATNLRFEDDVLGGRYKQTENGFADTVPVRPGSNVVQLVFSFELPYEKRLDFEQPLSYPVDSVVILVPEGGPEVSGEGVQDMGLREITGTSVQNYGAGPYEAGDILKVSLRGRPPKTEGASTPVTWQNVVIGLGALGLALVAVGLWWRSAALKRSEDFEEEALEEAAAEPAAGGEDRESLLRAIAELDDAFEAGELEEQEYHQRRQALKERLVALMRGEDD